MKYWKSKTMANEKLSGGPIAQNHDHKLFYKLKKLNIYFDCQRGEQKDVRQGYYSYQYMYDCGY